MASQNVQDTRKPGRVSWNDHEYTKMFYRTAHKTNGCMLLPEGTGVFGDRSPIHDLRNCTSQSHGTALPVAC